MENFAAALRVMGMGMLGIFSVTIVLIVVMSLLTKIFPPENNEEM